MRRLLAVLALLLGAACVACDRGASVVHAGDVAAVGTGSVDVLVVDEKDRPIEGAVVWALGTKLATPPPAEPVLLEQKGLEFVPRFLVARRGQTLVVTNDDPEVHNVHSSDACCAVNQMVSPGNKSERVLDQAGEVTFLCDIHAHMRCTLVVLDAIHARTDAKGHARLELPLGERKLRARALDRERGELTVEVASVTSARLVLQPPPRGPLIVAPEKLPWPALVAHLREGLEEAVKLARAGQGDAAREAAEVAVGTWFTADFYAAIRNKDEHSKAVADEIKSQLRRLASKLENAAAQGGDAVDQVARQVAKVCDTTLDIARALPKR